MKNIILKKNDFSLNVILVYIFVIAFEFIILGLQLNKATNIPIGIRVIQFLLPISFISFFSVSVYYQNKYISFILILCFQILCSTYLWSYYYFFTGQVLGFDANDALAYQLALEKSFGKSWKYLIEVLKSQPRTASLSDWGFPTYRFFIYKIVPDLTGGIFALVIINSIVHSISSLFVYKISKRYMNNLSAILVMALWGLSATSIHINTCGLKETIFSFFVVLAVYHLIEIDYKNKIFHFVMFISNVILIWFFRNYISLFLILVFLGCYPLRKLFYKNINLFVIGIVIVAFFGMNILSKFLPELRFVKYSRDKRLMEFFGSKGLIANTMNFCFAWIAPIPRFNHSAQIKQVIFSGYSIFSAFFSLFGFYGILVILKRKISKFYPLITFLLCNIILVIITCNSLDFRFQHPTTFIYDLLIVFGFSEIAKNGINIKYISKKRISLEIIQFFIVSFIFLLMFVYNKG